MDELEDKYEIGLTKAQALLINDRLRWTHSDQPRVIETKAEERNLTNLQKESWAVNTIKFKCAHILWETRESPDNDETRHKIKVCRREIEVLENVTNNSLEDRDIQRALDLELIPHILEWRRWEYLEMGNAPAGTSDEITHQSAIQKLKEGGSPDGQAGSSGPDRRASRRLRRAVRDPEPAGDEGA